MCEKCSGTENMLIQTTKKAKL